MQRINLFRPEFLPQPLRFSLLRVVQGLPLLIALLVAIGFGLQNLLRTEQMLTVSARQDLDTLLSQIASLQAPAQSAQPEQQGTLQQQIQHARVLLQSLHAHEHAVQQGFAASLQTLAEHHDEQIWLTRIRIGSGQIQLQGDTLTPERLPPWLAQLQSAPDLRGRRFAGLHIVREDDSPLLHFDLNGDELLELSRQQADASPAIPTTEQGRP